MHYDRSNELWRCGNLSWQNITLIQELQEQVRGVVLPKGTVESDEEYKDTAIREVKEETGASATIIQYVGKSHYSFTVPHDTVEKECTLVSYDGRKLL